MNIAKEFEPREGASPANQRGAALVVGLLFLVILSLGLLASFRTSVLQERMAGSFRSESLAEGAADSALRGGENWLWSFANLNGRLPIPRDDGPEVQEPASIWPPTRVFRQTASLIGGQSYADAAILGDQYGTIATEPRYQIEYMSPAARPSAGGTLLVSHQGATGTGATGTIVYYRITAHGAGGTDQMIRSVESTFTVTR